MFGTNALNRLLQPKTRSRPSVPDGVVGFAIGDIHGRADLLPPLLERILSECAAPESRRIVVICLGDYVDRGPASRHVIDSLIEWRRLREVESEFIRGNHDQTFLEFLSNPAVGVDWCAFGGRETMTSYGVEPPPHGRAAPEAWEAVRQALVSAVPEAHVAFLRNLRSAFELGDYFFAHAGARPGVPLQDQVDEDLLWIRQPFLDDRRRFSKVVVHGHTPTDDVYVDDRRIGLDTGAYATGVLTALRLEGQNRRLVQTRRTGQGSVELSEGDIL